MIAPLRILGLALLVTVPSPGSAGDGTVALQSADPSCADDSGNTYVNCGNGTVTDNRTGLVWLQAADCFGTLDWHEAVEIVTNLSDLPDAFGSDEDCDLSDHSSPGEWRMPSAGELLTMVTDAQILGCMPVITDDQGSGCWASPLECVLQGRNCSFKSVQSSFYWASSSRPSNPTRAWFWSFAEGASGVLDKDTALLVWPVRGGQ